MGDRRRDDPSRPATVMATRHRLVCARRPAMALAIAALLLGGQAVPAGAQEAPATSVTVAPVMRVPFAERAERVGRTEAVQDVDLRARIEGFLIERAFEEGANVEQGDLLFVIERAPYEAEASRVAAELARARAQQTKAILDLERARELRQRENVSQATLDEATAVEQAAAADVAAREAELRMARLNLGYAEIRAPVAGRIGRAAYSVGDLVGPNSDVLATLVTLDPIHVTWGVSEQVLLDVRRQGQIIVGGAGDPVPQVIARIRFVDGTYYEHPGRIDFLDNRVDPATGTQTARAVFANPDELLLPGQYVSIVLQLGEERDRLVIPQAAVQEDQAGRFVLVVDEQDKVTVRRVDLGPRDGINWVVESGVTEGELVIYQGVQKVRPGMAVDPVIATPEQPVTN